MCQSTHQPVQIVPSVQEAEYDVLDALEVLTVHEDEEIELEDNESEEFDETKNQTIRAKWLLDGAKTLDECVKHCHDFIEYLKGLKADGWELQDPVHDDWGFIKRA